MIQFFSADVGMTFEPFGLWHVLVLFLVFLSVFLLFLFRKRIRSYRHEKQVRYAIGIAGIFFEIALHAWSLANGIWTYVDNFPLAICFFSLVMGIYVMFTKSKSVFDIGYFWAIGGLVSMLFPDISYGPDRFRFYQFLFSHMLFFLMFMYMMFVHEYRPTGRGFIKSFVLLVLLTYVIVLPVDLLTNANFLFLVEADGTPFEVVSGHGYVLYLIGTFSFGLLVLLIWYVPIHILNHMETRRRKKKLA